MPRTDVIFYTNDDRTSPLLDCLATWPDKVVDKCYVRIERLHQLGHELRRPEADLLRDGIHELRVRHLNVNYRILYFFNDESEHAKAAILFDGLTKEDVIHAKQIDRAIQAKEKFAANPKKHTYQSEDDEDKKTDY